jgi:carboxypeptidase Q
MTICSLHTLFAFVLLPVSAAIGMAQSAADATIRRIYDEALTSSPAYEQLRELTTLYPGRLSGSPALAGAVRWGEAKLNALGLDRVWMQEVMVPHWERGAKESVRLRTRNGERTLAALALGGTIATPPGGITAGVVEVTSLAQVAELGREKIAGKIVFYNRPLDPRYISTSDAYREARDQRSAGPRAAARDGAVAVLVRSLTLALDDHPHTGGTAYAPGQPNVPAAALSTIAADTLSEALAADPGLQVEIAIHARWHPDVLSHNVIGELRGTEAPGEIILVGGHLDSWDVAPGAHDDGAGVVQSLEVLRIFQALGLKPRHTLRAVLFTNEENGLRGAIAYASRARDEGDKHVFAVETDSGGFSPRGFTLGSTQGDAHLRARRWLPLFEPYGIHFFEKGSGGADVAPLLRLGTTVGNLIPDSQRYFDIHHTTEDSIDKVNKRELELGAAALAALIYLVDTEGL